MTEEIADPAAWRWPHFSPDELRCKGDGTLRMSASFLDRLEKLRVAYGKPLVITSAYRSPEYNQKVAETGADGPHTTGHAVDIATSGQDALLILQLALGLGFTGFGLNQKGMSRFIHLDDLARPDFPRPALWTY